MGARHAEAPRRGSKAPHDCKEESASAGGRVSGCVVPVGRKALPCPCRAGDRAPQNLLVRTGRPPAGAQSPGCYLEVFQRDMLRIPRFLPRPLTQTDVEGRLLRRGTQCPEDRFNGHKQVCRGRSAHRTRLHCGLSSVEAHWSPTYCADLSAC